MKRIIIIVLFLRCAISFSQDLESQSTNYFHSYGDVCDIFVYHSDNHNIYDKKILYPTNVYGAVFVIEPSLSVALSAYTNRLKLKHASFLLIIKVTEDNKAKIELSNMSFQNKNLKRIDGKKVDQ